MDHHIGGLVLGCLSLVSAGYAGRALVQAYRVANAAEWGERAFLAVAGFFVSAVFAHMTAQLVQAADQAGAAVSLLAPTVVP